MVKYKLMISADLENLTNLQPQGGCDDPNFTYFFKLKCGCGEVSQKETCVSLGETLPLTQGGKGTTNLIRKCKFCGREGTVTMIPGRGTPLTQRTAQSGGFSRLMTFDCRGQEPVDFIFGGGWKVASFAGTWYEDVDLLGGEFAEYDEKGLFPVMISNLRFQFEVVKYY